MGVVAELYSHVELMDVDRRLYHGLKQPTIGTCWAVLRVGRRHPSARNRLG